jgi:hypothetical protein
VLVQVTDPLVFNLCTYPAGPKGGLAIAEALAGAIVPSGRLPYKYVSLWFVFLCVPSLITDCMLLRCRSVFFTSTMNECAYAPYEQQLLFELPGPILPHRRTLPPHTFAHSYPKSAGDIPYAYHHKPGDQCVDPVTKAYIKCQVRCTTLCV